MKVYAFVLALGGVVGAAAVAHAQKAPPPPPDALEQLQKQAGAIVGEGFGVGDPAIAAATGPGNPLVPLGVALRTSMQVPGDALAAPFAALDRADRGPEPAPAARAAPAPRHRRHARRYRHVSPATAG